jgi:bifunctional DNase/RNase
MAEKRVKMNVLGITFSQIQAGAYALILEEDAPSARRIPIVIGSSEAQSIAIYLENRRPPRPLTHDMFVTLMRNFDIRLEEVFIHKYDEGVFFSNMVFTGEKQIVMDTRTSDAIAVAIRCQAPIYTTKSIVEKNRVEMDDSEYDIPDDVSTFNVQKSDWTMEEQTKTELLSLLNDAVRSEDYEAASRIKDEMNKRFPKQK